MKTTFEKQTITFANESDYRSIFEAMGFSPSKVEICFTNGCSAYVSLNVNVVNADKMYADVFVYDGKASLKVRISDHASNLERICGGVSGNKLSLDAFKLLVENNVIAQ